ncbi:hypothetical protein [Azospirillum palustre]|uniref:hypothetical protein n=1 Tax=Azospirillum palustre TaxID=2044885 RepID=UPI00137B86D9|nr:hypothetical protein [Azospirillum palustre]
MVAAQQRLSFAISNWNRFLIFTHDESEIAKTHLAPSFFSEKIEKIADHGRRAFPPPTPCREDGSAPRRFATSQMQMIRIIVGSAALAADAHVLSGVPPTGVTP